MMYAAFTLLILCVMSSYAYDLDDDDFEKGYMYGDDMNIDYDISKRAAGPCQRCMHQPSDWWSCSSCYGRRSSGFTPYYGKRSSGGSIPPYYDGPGMLYYDKRSRDSDSDSELYNGIDDVISDDLYDQMSKRSLGACRCCMSYANSNCCSRCSSLSMFTKRSHSYTPGFVAGGGRGNCRSCCRRSTFNFGCCIQCL